MRSKVINLPATPPGLLAAEACIHICAAPYKGCRPLPNSNATALRSN